MALHHATGGVTQGGSWFTLSSGLLVPKFRGALVKKAADQTTANYSTPADIAWDNASAVYDTDSIWSSGANTRLSVPSGITKVRVGVGIDLSAVTAGSNAYLEIQKTGSASYAGKAKVYQNNLGTTPAWQAWTAVLDVTGGTDYFTAQLFCADTSITVVAATSWFAMELVA